MPANNTAALPPPAAMTSLLLLVSSAIVVGGVGINYGTLGNNLPPPKKVAQMLQSTLIDAVKIYDTDPAILDAFSGTGISLVVSIENRLVPDIAASPSAADLWFTSRLAPFLPATSVIGIAVGNEYLTSAGGNPEELVHAMRNVYTELAARGLEGKIKVSTPHSMAILASSFPPSSATFLPELAGAMRELVVFLADTGAPFMVNAYPYFAYRDNPTRIELEYALMGNANGVQDPKGYVYTNMLDAQIDAVRSAIRGVGGNQTVPITISESGWPSKGDPGDIAATPENAKIYNTRLIVRGDAGIGTPMDPSGKVEVFVFALFNENEKEGGATERNFGIFYGDGSKVYAVDLSCKFCSTGTGSGSGGFGEMMGGGGSGNGPRGWCVAKPHADEKVLQKVLDFCCGPGGVDCEELGQKGGCFEPNKLYAHASFAMNSYYQMHGRNYWNCDFKGTGLVTFSDPSYGNCHYPQQ